MKYYIGCDHAAFPEKEAIKALLQEEGFDVVDCGTYSEERANYPEYAKKVALSVQNDNESRGVLLCGSGIGVSMVANRFSGVRAALCKTMEDAQLSREHNDANILCLGARSTPLEQLKQLTLMWIKTSFEGGRHKERIELFNQLGEKGDC